MINEIKETETINTVNSGKQMHELIADLLPKKFGISGKIWVTVLILICCVGLYAYVRQLRHGLIITAMRDFTSWGIYVSNFVFFVAISLVGSLMSAILKLTNAHWRIPLTRISEIIAVSSILFASIIIVVDMGRPDRMWHLFVYGRIQSPIIWDVFVITTYLAVSILLLYLPLIPDLALCKNEVKNKWQKKFFGIISLNWQDTKEQYKILKKSIRLLAILIIPLALAIHTVTSWLFATTFRAGWDSTNFGPYFVSGAFMVGTAAVIAVMYVLRNHYHLEKYITHRHFDLMGKLLVLLSLLYFYFNINEYLVPAYKMKTIEGQHLSELFTGRYAPMFWMVQVFGMILPVIVLTFKKGRLPVPMFIISLFVVVAAWFKRFLIVTPTLLYPFIPIQNVPESWTYYSPTWEEWAITLGSLAGALLVITFFVRFVPIIPIVEIAEERGLKHEFTSANKNET